MSLSFKPFCVVFIDPSLKDDLEKLEKGTFEEKRLAGWIRNAIDRLAENPECGIQIPRKYWSEKYIRDYGIDNLWKINLPMAGGSRIYCVRLN